ncbi:hypothetical protein [Rothia mucilaginosa]|uniref:hypothetical protein n=1 Tax=Rothia mucilaginosa TaxID=43675 RepID=UPI0034D540C3
MADRPTAKREGTHHENIKHEEAYQPLWDTDQSIPEYMALLMDQQPSTTEDAELHEDSEEYEYEELEHPDPDYEYVYPGAPKRYDSARRDSEDEEPEYEDAEYEDDEYEEYESEPSDDADDNDEDTESTQGNQPVALASTQSSQPTEPAQPALSACEGATENTGHLTTDGTQAQSPPEPITVDTSLPVATEPIYGIPDPNLQPMQLLGALSSDAGPTQLASVRWWNKTGAAVTPWDALGEETPGEEAETARIIGYIPASTPEATVDWAKARRGYIPWLIFMVAMQVINPFLLLPLVNIVSMDAALQLLVLYLALAMQTTLLAPLIWLILMIYSLVQFPQKRQEAVARATTYGAFWYHPVYDRALQEADHPDAAGEPEGLPASAE